MRRVPGILIILLMAVVLLPGLAGGATYTVSTTSDANCADLDCDLQSALVAAEAVGDDTLNIAPGLYNGTVFEYNTANTGALIINGDGPGLTSIQGDGTNRALSLVGIGDLTVKNVGISNGMAASGNGGGLYASSTGGSVWVENCLIENNATVDGDGGGLFAATTAALTVKGNTFTANEANTASGPDGRGGGFYTAGSAFDPLTLADNTFDGNIAHGDGALGGGAYAFRADGPVEISGNRFLNNVSAGDAGGLYVATFGSFGNLVVRNNAFVGNSAQVEAGAAIIGAELGLFHVVNNTATGNAGNQEVGGVRFDIQMSANIYNNIFWANEIIDSVSPEDEGEDIVLNDVLGFGVTAELKYNDIGDKAVWGAVTVDEGIPTTNISVDPMLVTNDYHISAGSSPVIDAGDDTAPSLPSVDIDGDARILGPHVDMGADEVIIIPGPPIIQVTDSQGGADDHSIDFGNVSVGASPSHTVTVENAGVSTLEIDPIAQPASPFSVINDGCVSNSSLGAGETCTFDVQFAPDAPGDYNGSVDIVSNDGTVTVTLAGTGLSTGVPDIAITNGVSTITELNFGRLLTGDPKKQLGVTVMNEGTAPLEITSVSLPGGITPFSIDSENCTTTSPLDSGGTCDITVGLISTGEVADYTDELQIISNDEDENPATLALLGHNNYAAGVPVIVISVVDDDSGIVMLQWNASTDPDGDPIEYDVYVCKDDDTFETCPEPVNTVPIASAVDLTSPRGPWKFASALFALLAVGLVMAGPRVRKGSLAVLLGIALIAGIASLALLPGCSGDSDTTSSPVPPVTPSDFTFEYQLPERGHYYWKVKAWDVVGGNRYDSTDSEVNDFTW